MIIHCPICGKEVDFKRNPYRPFCSKRCKMIDLGAWFKEDYRIEMEPSSVPLQEGISQERKE